MSEEFYRNFLKQLELINPDFYWGMEMDSKREWTGTYFWALKNSNLYAGKGRFINHKEIVESVSKHIQIHENPQ